MLVLSRKPQQIIDIGDGIEILVIAIRGDQVRLGITAPGMRIDRREISEQKQLKPSHDSED